MANKTFTDAFNLKVTYENSKRSSIHLLPQATTPNRKLLIFLFSITERKKIEKINSFIEPFSDEYEIDILFCPPKEIKNELLRLKSRKIVGVFLSPQTCKRGVTALYDNKMGSLTIFCPRVKYSKIHQGPIKNYAESLFLTDHFPAQMMQDHFHKYELVYEVPGRVKKKEIKKSGKTFILEMLVKYVPTRHDNVCFYDYSVMERTISYLLQKELNVAVEMKEIFYQMGERIKFVPGEKFIIICEVSISLITDNNHSVSLKFLKDGEVVYTAQEVLQLISIV
jgi:hypothetical protein